jgi:hypothetical protein
MSPSLLSSLGPNNNGSRRNQNALLQDLLAALQDDDMMDITLEGHDGIPVEANRFVLAARSNVLKRMLYGSFREAKSTTIYLHDYDSVTLEAIVEYCSRNEITKFRLHHQMLHRTTVSARRLVRLFKAADFLELTPLASLVSHMAHSLTSRYPPLACAIYDEADVGTLISQDALCFLQCRPYATLPPDDETGGGIDCLSAPRLALLLQDKELQAGELFLFQMLQQWVKSHMMRLMKNNNNQSHNNNNSDQQQQHHYNSSEEILQLAQASANHLVLENIEPLDLLGPVKQSKLCLDEHITNAITHQALKASHNRVWSLACRGRPDVDRILVEDAGSKDVNGVYYRIHGLTNGELYSKREVSCGQVYVYTLSCSVHHKTQEVQCRIFCSKLLTHRAIWNLVQQQSRNGGHRRGRRPAPSTNHIFQPLMQVLSVTDAGGEDDPVKEGGHSRPGSPPVEAVAVAGGTSSTMRNTRASSLSVGGSRPFRVSLRYSQATFALPCFGVLQMSHFALDQILLSDGEYYITATMSPELSMSLRSKELVKNALIKILNYEKYELDGTGKCAIRLHKISLISQDPGHQFGNPMDYHDAYDEEEDTISTGSSSSGNEPVVVVASATVDAPIENQICHELLMSQQQEQQQKLSARSNQNLSEFYSCHYPVKASPLLAVDSKIPSTGWQIDTHGQAPCPKCRWIPAAAVMVGAVLGDRKTSSPITTPTWSPVDPSLEEEVDEDATVHAQVSHNSTTTNTA